MKFTKWITHLFTAKRAEKKVLFSFDIVKRLKIGKPFLYVNSAGVLIFKDEIFNHPVYALSEWDALVKKKLQVDNKHTVLDVIIRL